MIISIMFSGRGSSYFDIACIMGYLCSILQFYMYMYNCTHACRLAHEIDVHHMISAVHTCTCRSMGENLEEVEQFDRRMQSVAEGTYHPSHSAMETFPVRCDIVSLCYKILMSKCILV